MIRILVVDDHALVRRGLIELLQELPDGAQFGEAGSAADATALGLGEHWDVVLLDLGLPDRHGLDVLRELHAARPELPVLILTMFPEDQLALRVLEIGAAGYLTKESAPEELIRAVERVMAGHKYLSPAMTQAVADGLGGGGEAHLPLRMSSSPIANWRFSVSSPPDAPSPRSAVSSACLPRPSRPIAPGCCTNCG
jgi:DNA-binding NarL/FixJ family response regulator